MRVELNKKTIPTTEQEMVKQLLNTFISSDEKRFDMNLENTCWEEIDIRNLISEILDHKMSEFDAFELFNDRLLYFHIFKVGDITYQYAFIANDPDNVERNIILERV
jgi:hypothetical protein